MTYVMDMSLSTQEGRICALNDKNTRKRKTVGTKE